MNTNTKNGKGIVRITKKINGDINKAIGDYNNGLINFSDMMKALRECEKATRLDKALEKDVKAFLGKLGNYHQNLNILFDYLFSINIETQTDFDFLTRNEGNSRVNCFFEGQNVFDISISWYKMPSGIFEITAYVC
jgi:hypothetical protein